MEFVLEIPEVQEIKTLEMLPRYSDEKVNQNNHLALFAISIRITIRKHFHTIA